jgi:hypothetical protein
MSDDEPSPEYVTAPAAVRYRYTAALDGAVAAVVRLITHQSPSAVTVHVPLVSVTAPSESRTNAYTLPPTYSDTSRLPVPRFTLTVIVTGIAKLNVALSDALCVFDAVLSSVKLQSEPLAAMTARCCTHCARLAAMYDWSITASTDCPAHAVTRGCVHVTSLTMIELGVSDGVYVSEMLLYMLRAKMWFVFRNTLITAVHV